MPADGHRGGPGLGEAHRDRPEGLHGVSVEGDPSGGAQLTDPADRLHRAHLVVGPHGRQQGDALRSLGEHRLERGQIHHTFGVDRNDDQLGLLVGLQPFGGLENRVVLQRRQQDAAAAPVLILSAASTAP